MKFTPVELRVLGCLLEKQRTTPDGYPLSLNSLRSACNQSTNRDPVVDYDEATIREALGRLGRNRYIRSGAGHGGRTLKYRHLIDEEMNLADDQLTVLGVLMLRGPQTPGEIKGRTERWHSFEGGISGVLETLQALIDRDMVAQLERKPGQKEERYAHLLGEEEVEAAEIPAGGIAPSPSGPPTAEVAAALHAVSRSIQHTLSAVEGLTVQCGLHPDKTEEIAAEVRKARTELENAGRLLG